MTNKEILQADMLDILFEHRNKLYGAYVLRKTYSKRLGVALSVALSIVLLFVLMSFVTKKNNRNSGRLHDDTHVQLIDVILPEEKKPEPPPEKPLPKPPEATVNYQTFKIVDDDKVKEPIVDLMQIANANIGSETTPGLIPDETVKPPESSSGTGNAPVKDPEPEPQIALPSRNPSFPGGTEAWLNFLRRYLSAPEDLEAGQRIEVLVRFWVDINGQVSRPEIVKSGGSSFDKEVLRVMKKMPKWEPAIQHGNYVAVAYTQPVIFMGVEE